MKQCAETSQVKAPPVEEPFGLWKRFVRIRAQDRERDRMQMLSRVLQVIEELARRYSWEELYIFGSITLPGRFYSRSDVDIAVRGLNKFDHFAFIGDFSMLLGRCVDVVRLEECRFAESIISKGLKWRMKEP